MGSSSSSSLDGYPEETFLGTAVSFEVEKGQVQDPVPGNNSSSSSSRSSGRRCRKVVVGVPKAVARKLGIKQQ